MSGVRGIAALTTSEALGAAAAETVLQLVAAAHHRAHVVEWDISFNGQVTTDEPVVVELLRQTSAGTSSSLTINKQNEADDETIQTTALQDFTGEPTGTTVIRRYYVHPQRGYVWAAGGDVKPIPIIGGSRLGWRVTAPDAVDCAITVVFEE